MMQRLGRYFGLIILIFVLTALFCWTEAARGFHDIWEFPAFSFQPLIVPTISPTTGDILVDNFEYWDSPYNHGWRQTEPAYPVYGFGMGYATRFNTVMDLQEGSRVLDVYRPASIFLIGTPYERHAIQYNLFTPPGADNPDGEPGIDITKFRVISFDFRAPLGIEPWDIFEMDVIGEGKGETVVIRFLLLEPPDGSTVGVRNTHFTMYNILSEVKISQAEELLQVDVLLGRSMLDGSWHGAWVDLVDEVEKAVTDEGLDPNAWGIERANAIRISGQMFRLDNLFFRIEAGHIRTDYPEVFEMGPLYAQIFEPYRYIFVSDYSTIIHEGGTQERMVDLMVDMNNFITDPNLIIDNWIQDSNIGGIIQMDTNYLNPDHPSYGKPEPYYSNLLGRDFVIDINLALCADPKHRMGQECPRETIENGPLGWNATIGGYGATGVQSFVLQPLPVNPYDGMPTYLMAEYVGLDAIQAYGKPSIPPEVVFTFESALWNSGIEVWPNVAALDYTPQYFEDLIVFIEVTDGVHSEVAGVPISVVNYPVENYPPFLSDTDPLLFYVGERKSYAPEFLDPDCFIFSLSPTPATSHVPGYPINQNFRRDMANLTWRLTINGMASYQYGPWIEDIIDPCSGLVSWVAKFEGTYEAILTCTDDRGATSAGVFKIYAVNKGTWLNHPPLILDGFPSPLVIKAGEEYIDHPPELQVVDPDGDTVYASCNIGSIGRWTDGRFVWKFQTNFPGTFRGEIIFYDLRGGYSIMNFDIVVKPWWTY